VEEEKERVLDEALYRGKWGGGREGRREGGKGE
jgi:hypothetical protein